MAEHELTPQEEAIAYDVAQQAYQKIQEDFQAWTQLDINSDRFVAHTKIPSDAIDGISDFLILRLDEAQLESAVGIIRRKRTRIEHDHGTHLNRLQCAFRSAINMFMTAIGHPFHEEDARMRAIQISLLQSLETIIRMTQVSRRVQNPSLTASSSATLGRDGTQTTQESAQYRP